MPLFARFFTIFIRFYFLCRHLMPFFPADAMPLRRHCWLICRIISLIAAFAEFLLFASFRCAGFLHALMSAIAAAASWLLYFIFSLQLASSVTR